MREERGMENDVINYALLVFLLENQLETPRV